MSIWDTFSADPKHSEDGGNTTVATDFYNKYEEDIALMKEFGQWICIHTRSCVSLLIIVGVNAHRMSLSWSRIIPNGGRDQPINEKGIEFYRKVLTSLKKAGIVS